MSSFTYVTARIARGKHAFNVILDGNDLTELKRLLGLKATQDLRMVVESYNAVEKKVTLVASPSSGYRPSYREDADEYRWQARWDGDPAAFGPESVRLYVNADRKLEATVLGLHPANSKLASAEQRKAAAPAPAPATACDPGATQVSVQLCLPGQPPLTFVLPVADAFGVALDWTRRGFGK